MTQSANPKNPPEEGEIELFELPDSTGPARSQSPQNEQALQKKKECGSKRSASKSDITDQIGVHLRSVYDDILAQPVPGRFHELLRELENASATRPSKDGP